ncbi:MAG: CNNM domain-containing protein, partial [Planctomycetaceae bacterium]
MNWLDVLLVVLLFAVGLRLSAFFSGSETGFYRISFPRLSIDAQAGDRVAKRLMWFARNPSAFVATTLVGNNLANYLTTVAISLGVPLVAGAVSETVEVGAAMLLSPVVFLFGELLPKNLYYRAPLSLLRRDSTLFMMFYWLLLPASW